MLLSKATYSALGIYIFCQYVCSLGIEPTTFCAANTMTLYLTVYDHECNISVVNALVSLCM